MKCQIGTELIFIFCLLERLLRNFFIFLFFRNVYGRH